MEPIVTKRYSVEPGAYLRAVWRRGLWPRLGIIAGLYALIAIGMGVFAGPQAGLATGVGLSIVVVILVALRYVMSLRSVRHPMNRNVFGPRTVTIDGESIRTSMEAGTSSEIPWSEIQFAEHRGPFTFLFLTQIQHLILPDDAFEDLGAFYRLVSEKTQWRGAAPRVPDRP